MWIKMDFLDLLIQNFNIKFYIKELKGKKCKINKFSVVAC